MTAEGERAREQMKLTLAAESQHTVSLAITYEFARKAISNALLRKMQRRQANGPAATFGTAVS